MSKEQKRKLIKMMSHSDGDIALQGRNLFEALGLDFFRGVNFPKLFSTPISWHYLVTGEAPEGGIGESQLGWWLDEFGYMGLHLCLTNLDDADLSGCSFSYPRWYRKKRGTTDSYLESTSFRGANLEGADFRGAWIYNVSFEGANLEGANFTGAQIELSNFKNATGTPIGYKGKISE